MTRWFTWFCFGGNNLSLIIWSLRSKKSLIADDISGILLWSIPYFTDCSIFLFPFLLHFIFLCFSVLSILWFGQFESLVSLKIEERTYSGLRGQTPNWLFFCVCVNKNISSPFFYLFYLSKQQQVRDKY